MSDQPRRSNQSDPTAERTSEQSTQSASGLSGGRPDPEATSEQEADDVLNRKTEKRNDTPHRHEEERGEEAEKNPAMPGDGESTLRTEI